MIEPVNVAFKSSNLGVAQDVVSAAGNSSTKAGLKMGQPTGCLAQALWLFNSCPLVI
jgi:hypothetical protein